MWKSTSQIFDPQNSVAVFLKWFNNHQMWPVAFHEICNVVAIAGRGAHDEVRNSAENFD